MPKRKYLYNKNLYICTLKNNRGRVPQINQTDYACKNQITKTW